MRNNLLLPIITILFLNIFLFTSCEKEDQDLLTEATINQQEITPDTQVTEKASGITNERVYRNYQGGSYSVHTYKTQSGTGYALGRREGIAFVTPTSPTSAGVDRNKYNFLWFLLHPERKDFVLTTSSSEFWTLKNSGWRNVTYKYILIQKSSGNGTSKLYRFYDVANSDHLYTKNYSEGVNAGLKYEGVVGWVK